MHITTRKVVTNVGGFYRGSNTNDTSKAGYDRRAAELNAQIKSGKGLDKYDQQDYNRIQNSGLTSAKEILNRK